MKKTFITLLFSFSGILLNGQPNLDSLFRLWQDSNLADSTRVNAYNDFVEKGYLYSNPDTTVILAEKLLSYAKVNVYPKAAAKGLRLQGIANAFMGNYASAENLFNKSLKIFKEIDYLPGVANNLKNLGNISLYQGNRAKALDYALKALAMYEKVGDQDGIAASLDNLGNLYFQQEEYEAALKYGIRSLKIYEEIGDKNAIAGRLSNVGSTYWAKNDYSLALEYNQQALKIYREIDSKQGIALIMSNNGAIYFKLGNYTEALNREQEAQKLYEEMGIKNKLAGNQINIGTIHKKLNNYTKALEYCKRGLKISEEIGALPDEEKACNCLYESYKALGKGNEALVYLERKHVIEESLNEEETSKKLMKMEFARQMLADSIATAEKERLVLEAHQEQVRQNNKTRNMLASGGLFLFILAGGIYSRLRYTRKAKAIIEKEKKEVEKKKEQLEKKNREVMDSLTYAKRIQATILPPLKVVKRYLNNSFVLYLPKDIVAGDFYWMEAPENENMLFFAVCDCTGHGVPGAMVSVVCHNALNKSVREINLRKPSLILDKVSELVTHDFSLNNDDSDEVTDGMDASLCALNIETGQLQWAGANNALWLIKPNGKLREYKADKQAIGKSDRQFPFTNHTIQLEKGDTLYLFSDGYADQFGGEHDRKFQRKNLKELLVSIQKESLEKQRTILYNTFENWRGEKDQTDDVCLIGVRI